MAADWTTIRERSGECACSWCGCPLYVGDRVLWHEDIPTCGGACAAKVAELWPAPHFNPETAP